MDLSAEQIRWILMGVIVLVVSVCVHEFGHALVADLLGDDLPRREGRLTLNPMAHADPIGTLLLPLLLATTGAPGFGWGKPVMVNPARFSRRFSMVTAHMMVSLAGPAMNLLLGLLLTLARALLWAQGVITPGDGVDKVLHYTIIVNFTLFFFNLLPVSPLDGAKVILSFLPRRWHIDYERAMIYGPFALMIVLIPPLPKIFVVPAQMLGAAAFDGILRLVA